MTVTAEYAIELGRQVDELEAENAKLRIVAKPASRQLLNITKAALDHAEAENAKLRAALSWMADQDPQLVDAAKEKFGLED